MAGESMGVEAPLAEGLSQAEKWLNSKSISTRSSCVAASFNNLHIESSNLQLLGLFTTS